MIEALIQNNRRLRIEYKNILRQADPTGTEMLGVIQNYLIDFARYYCITEQNVENSYLKFVSRYVSDFKIFTETGKYPFELPNGYQLERTDYDLALILSIFFIPARYAIFRETLSAIKCSSGEVLIIGVGAALEIELISHFYPGRKIQAYDISISDFVKQRYKSSHLYEQEFNFAMDKLYDCILAIELLEHLSEPFDFLNKCASRLIVNGHLICTTASNMPQFDHMYNFHNKDFERRANLCHLNVMLKRDLKHILLNPSILSYNTFYHLIKS